MAVLTSTTTVNGANDDGTTEVATITEDFTSIGDIVDPIRYDAPVGLTSEMILDYSTTAGFATVEQGATQYAEFWNLDKSNSCTIIVKGTGGTMEYSVKLGPGEWFILHGYLMATGTGVSPAWENITQVNALFENAPGVVKVNAFNFA